MSSLKRAYCSDASEKRPCLARRLRLNSSGLKARPFAFAIRYGQIAEPNESALRPAPLLDASATHRLGAQIISGIFPIFAPAFPEKEVEVITIKKFANENVRERLCADR